MIFKNDLLLRTIAGEKVERPPVWLMRQAGRILPQYRALRSQLRDFKELVETPDKAAEVTIQPIDELDVDAAIIFSDILVIPDAMGLPYEMVEKVGPSFPNTINTAEDVRKLKTGQSVADDLGYVYEAIEETVKRLDGRVPLIGFCGAPWTLLAYMVEGKGSKTFSKAKGMLYADPKLAHELLQKITDALIAYLKLQIKSGVRVVQVFDSWAGLLPPVHYQSFSMPYLKQICNAIDEVPITVFAKGAWFALKDISQLDCKTVGLDWTTDPLFAREQMTSPKILQGNLDPCQLYGQPEDIRQKTEEMIRTFGHGHIVNLGHGVYPDTPLENVRTFVNTVKNFTY